MASPYRVRNAVLVGGVAIAVLAGGAFATSGAAHAIEIKPDRDFAGDGRAIVRSPGDDYATDVVIDGNESYVIGSSPLARDRDRSRMVVAKYRAGGRLDPSFGNQGRRFIELGRSSQAFSGALAPDGGILISGWSVGKRLTVAVIKLRPNGSLDRDFSGDGVSHIAVGAGVDWPLVEAEPDGSIWLAWASVRDYNYDKHVSDFRVMHLTRNGRVDQSFSGDGVRVFDMRTHDYPYFSDVDSSGRFYLTGMSRQRDRSPALTSVLSISDDGPSHSRTINLWSRAGNFPLTVDVDDVSGRLMLGLTPDEKPGWGGVRLTGDLSLDATYSNDGITKHDCRCTSVSGVNTPQGLVLVGNANKQQRTAVARFTPTGRWDGNLGNATYNLFPDWEYWIETEIDASGRLVLVGSAKGQASDLAIARLKMSPI